MAPSRFQIYVDQSMRQPGGHIPAPEPVVEQHRPQVQPPVMNQQPIKNSGDNVNPAPQRYIPDVLQPNQRFYFDERKLYPPTGEEFSFEELNLFAWTKRQQDIHQKLYCEQLKRENEELKMRIEVLTQQFKAKLQAQTQAPPQRSAMPEPMSPGRRISVVPQSLMPTQGLEYTDMSVYEALDNAPTAVDEYWKHTLPQDNNALNAPDRNPFANDKITVPIDQSQYFRDHAQTSTPTSKGSRESENNKKSIGSRRMSRPSMGGSPTLKLSPITETSRDCNSKSSSSSSALSGTPGTAKKVLQPLITEPMVPEEPDRPLDPNDPTSYRKLLVGLAEPLERRPGYFRHNRSLPKIRHGACFTAGADNYLVDKELSKEAKLFTAQLLTDDSNDDSSSMDIPIKTFCVRVDEPANEWLYYICNELHRRLVRQKSKPDIELSVMIANPAIFYNDGSILIDEYFRFFTLQQFLDACRELNKPFPKSVAANVALELIQVVRQIHSCGIIHMNINPKNIVFTCCPNREDVANVDERTSIVKLIGFDRSMDTRLLPSEFKFDSELPDLITCEMREARPWTFEVDWYGALNCIHAMFFNEDMQVSKSSGKWMISKQFKGCPTGVWSTLFEQLLNITDMNAATSVVDQAVDDLVSWVKANVSFVLKEAAYLDGTLEEYCKLNNRSMKT